MQTIIDQIWPLFQVILVDLVLAGTTPLLWLSQLQEYPLQRAEGHFYRNCRCRNHPHPVCPDHRKTSPIPRPTPRRWLATALGMLEFMAGP
ncbi:MAG: hypothetical protein Ct9H300mP14_02590 [Gammaproteobacteria bacterium]|nr:MAG: hypothetical protein Ct9H300mP14_02590 [Gammaproteobacteria bacterium]